MKIHNGVVCSGCGRTVTDHEYSSGESNCCYVEVIPEEQFERFHSHDGMCNLADPKCLYYIDQQIAKVPVDDDEPTPPCTTYFPSYPQRLTAVAQIHGVTPEHLKALLDDAYGETKTVRDQYESRAALRQLAHLAITTREINWLFQYHVAA